MLASLKKLSKVDLSHVDAGVEDDVSKELGGAVTEALSAKQQQAQGDTDKTIAVYKALRHIAGGIRERA